MHNQQLDEVIIDLYEIGVFQFGNFTLKTGINSPVYIDLRRIISRPKLLVQIARLMGKNFLHLSVDIICGVPYTALPLATVISIEYGIPMILKRKEEKNYGLKRMVEGIFEKGSHCVIIEDIVTSGSSILETKQELKKEDLIVKEAVVFLDRNQGGEGKLLERDVKIYAVCTLPEVLGVLLHSKKIDRVHFDRVMDFLNTRHL